MSQALNEKQGSNCQESIASLSSLTDSEEICMCCPQSTELLSAAGHGHRHAAWVQRPVFRPRADKRGDRLLPQPPQHLEAGTTTQCVLSLICLIHEQSTVLWSW